MGGVDFDGLVLNSVNTLLGWDEWRVRKKGKRKRTSKPAMSARFTEARKDALKLAMSSSVMQRGTHVCGASNGMSLALMTLSGHPPTYPAPVSVSPQVMGKPSRSHDIPQQ